MRGCCHNCHSYDINSKYDTIITLMVYIIPDHDNATVDICSHLWFPCLLTARAKECFHSNIKIGYILILLFMQRSFILLYVGNNFLLEDCFETYIHMQTIYMFCHVTTVAKVNTIVLTKMSKKYHG